MKRRSVRWFTIEMRGREALALRDIASKMLEEQYTPRRTAGFALKVANDKSVEGLFAERREVEETIQDPLGRTFTNRRVVVRQFRFRITKEYPQLEVVDAAVGFSAFFSRLVAMLGQRAVIEPVFAPPGEWLAAIELGSESPITVRAIVVSEIPLTPSISAQVAVQGEEDVRTASNSLVGARSSNPPSYDRVVLSWLSGRAFVSCELGRRGARIEASGEEAARIALRRALALLNEKRQVATLAGQEGSVLRLVPERGRPRRTT